MLTVTPSPLSFTAGTAATQNLTFANASWFTPVSIDSIVFAGNTAQHPVDVQKSGPFTVKSPLGDGTGFASQEIIGGATLVVPVTYSGVGVGNSTIVIVYNDVGGIAKLLVPVVAS